MVLWYVSGVKMPDSEVTIGVDFGTTNSVAAICLPDGVEVLTNDIDSRKTPSCVYFKDAEREIGEAALRMAPSYPFHTIRNVKSVLGMTESTLGKRVPLGAVPFEFPKQDGTINIKISNKKSFSPEEVTAMVLMEIKKSAEMHLKKEVSKAVIAVPSYFSASQRQAIVDASFLAGLHVTALVNDTTAAALAYAHDREMNKLVVLVDIGGGGSSVSVVRVECNQVWVQAHSGPRLPGGEDFDEKMVEYLQQCVKKNLQKEVVDPRDTEILRSQWVKAKEKLSRIPQASIKVFLPGIDQEFEEDLKQSDFQAQCGELFKEITDGLLRTLEGVCLAAVHEVLVVGGSSRNPLLRNLIKKEMMIKQLSKAINPDEAVAEGAALFAAGCVEVKEEKLSLNTEVIIDDKPWNLHRNVTSLPRRVDAPYFWRKAIEVQQEVNIGTTVPMINLKRSGLKFVEITVSGLLRIIDNSGEMNVSLCGCLPRGQVEKQLKKMEAIKSKEVEDAKKVEAKNALERLLRVERMRETSPGDPFHDDVMDLRKECSKRLNWLTEYSSQPAKKYDEMRLDIERQVSTLVGKQERERKRVDALNSLRQLLQTHLAADVPEDPFLQKALDLKQLCKDKLAKLAECESLSTEEIEKQAATVLEKGEDLENDRMRHATHQRNGEAIMLFNTVVIEATLRWQDSAAIDPYLSKVRTLCDEAKQWLQTHSTVDAATCNHRRELFERDVSAQEDELRNSIRRAEERRQRSYEAAKNKLTEALSIEVSLHNDRLDPVVTKYRDGWKELREWLLGHPSEQQSKYDAITKDVSDGIIEIQKIQAVEEERVRLTAFIDSTLTAGLEEFKDNQDDSSLFVRLITWCRKWMLDNPIATNTNLGNCRVKIDEFVESLRTVRRHLSVQEKETNLAQEARKRAMASASELLLIFGVTEPSVAQDQPTSFSATVTSSRGSYVPEQFTRDNGEPMEVEMEEQVNGENQLDVNGLFRNGATFDSSAMVEVWKCFQQSADNQRQLAEPLSHRTPHQCQAILESLSEELAVEALSFAGCARLTAVLLDRKVTADQELVSLSVRYLSVTGSPDERLLLVQDRRTFNGPGKEFALSLFRRFKELCVKAGVESQIRIELLSAPDCGSFVPFFTAFAQQNGWCILRADSISEPLDSRLATAFYESTHPDNDIFVTVLSTVDTLRQKFAVDGRWFPLLRRQCNYVKKEDPWLTYTSSTKFMLSHRKELSELLRSVAKSDPKEKMVMDSINQKLGQFFITCCLVAFDGVFSELHGESDLEKDFKSSWKSILSRLEGHEAVLLGSEFQKSLIERIKLTTGVTCMTRDNIALLDRIVTVAINITNQSLIGFEDCRIIKRCLECQEDMSGGRFNLPNHNFYDELCSFRARYPQANLDLSCICYQMLRFEFRRDLPALYEALQRALTLPLLPPVSDRSAVQLCEGARRTNAVLRVFNSAAVPIAARKYRPSDITISAAVASVLTKCPELKDARPRCTSAAV